MSGSQDPAWYPGTEVLRNKGGFRDADQLREFEYTKTALREADAPTFPPTAQGFRDLHKHLLGDVYEWAGELRTIGLTKQESRFVSSGAIAGDLDSQFQRLGWDNHLKGLSADRFAAGAAAHIAELNRIHPFREGNGRAMRLHLEQLAAQAGHQVDWRQFSKVEWDAASVRAFNGSPADLARVIAGGMEPKARISVEAALERVGELHGQAVQDIRDRHRAIRDMIQRGQGSTVTTKEMRALGEELTALGSPDRNVIVGALERHRVAGGREITVLAGQGASARDQLNAIRQGTDRAIAAGERASQTVRQSGDYPAPSPRATSASYWGQVAAKAPAEAPTTAPGLRQGRTPRF